MKGNTWLIVGVIVVALAIFLYTKSPASGRYDSFAQCLTENDVKMYGAFWCPHCQNQKKAFGASWQYVTYIECSLPDGRSQTEFCQRANIKGYPTWEFGDGSRIEGEASFEQLAQRSGCSP
jgi:hypothetical protein